MKTPYIKGLIIVTTCLLLSACTETIIREVPADSAANSESAEDKETSPGTGSNMIDGSNNTTSGENNTNTGGSTDDATETPPPSSSILLDDPASELTIGEPGISVDCMNSLPCRWVSSDTQFALTVTSADNVATRDRLSLSYAISTTHDSTISVSSAELATDSSGVVLRSEDQTLGEGTGGTSQGLLAGDQLLGMINFNKSATSNTLSNWAVSAVDSGVIRTAEFSNIPVGSLVTTLADCNYTLPCIWTTPGNDVAISLISVGGLSINNRVSVNFSVEASSDMNIAVDEGAKATGSDGTLFKGRTLELGNMSDYRKLSAQIMARSPYFGSVHFYRTPMTPAHLDQLSLVLYQDEPVPRWNPKFINVPID